MWPLLKTHCAGCHGEAKQLAGGLDLRLRRRIVAGGDTGPAIVPGDSQHSLLIQHVRSGEMPPKDELRLGDDEVAMLAAWVDAGAPTLRDEPRQDPRPGEIWITDVERSYWAYRPIARPPLPTVGKSDNAIDAFVLNRLQSNGLDFSQQADRRTLIRRATFDLLGLPPTPAEVEAFANDPSPLAYSRLIDRLLESPHYGERWGRHWLDAVGYADSEGYNDKDVIREDAWRYRDYVVRSLNQDKPWDRFIVEQLAGDELAGVTHDNAEQAANADPQTLEWLTATGFLRMAPDGTGSGPDDAALARNQAVTETLKVVSTALLGSSLACAECHHHRFDPIPQEDFYRLRAVFAPAMNVDKWREPKSRRMAILSEDDRRQAADVETRAKQLDEQHNRMKQETLELVLERVLESIPEERRDFARQAFATPKDKRSEQQRLFCEEEFPMLGLLRTGTLHLFLARYQDGDELKKPYEDVLAEAAALRADKPAPVYVRVATEVRGTIPETRLLHRGDHTAPLGDPLPPGGLSVLNSFHDQPLPANNPKLRSSGRRLAYARQLTDGRHPLVARVLVNRFWQHHFGVGLVATAGEFGRQGELPSHPELLDWLAADFMESGWRLKRLHRLIMTSRCYRQDSRRREEAEAVDAENRLLWRMPVRRLEAEAVRDAMLSVAGELRPQLFGPPAPVAVTDGGLVAVAGAATDGAASAGADLRRSLYIQVRRSQPVAMLEVFDSPQLEPNCHRRVVSTVAPQSLELLNGEFVLARARAVAMRLSAECPDGDNKVTRLWQLAYGRNADVSERAAARDFIQRQTEDLREQEPQPELAAWASLAQVLLGSNEFLYID
ncbi:MAG: PSD1 domain-containing protein [Planctomycetales bacterium]|nr:PSD1 domain-containing protein [Planctomycetales bacterium]